MDIPYRFPVILSFMIAGACGNNAQTEAARSVADKLAPTVDVGTCLINYQTKLDKLLPLEQIQKYYSGDMAKAEKKYSYRPEARSHDTDTYEYVWPSDRMQKINLMGREMDIHVSNRIGLSWLGNDMFMMAKKGSPVENFRFFYRNMTTSEKEEAFKKAGEMLEKKGYDQTKTQSAVGLGKELSSEAIMFRPVEGVGDAATWRIKEKHLIVLAGKTTFQVITDVSANEDENIALAKKLAAEVLSKCR
ncbi:hypothetical protein WBJ53_14410 [Spirosoma sp. SC4-14]|uniref:hypothetical protein n=1 Tax=Spirosoma sp. SC4-14 TaxID=3128900 RepID=UPI0030D02A05